MSLDTSLDAMRMARTLPSSTQRFTEITSLFPFKDVQGHAESLEVVLGTPSFIISPDCKHSDQKQFSSLPTFASLQY